MKLKLLCLLLCCTLYGLQTGQAQNITVSGTVKNNFGNPLNGATVATTNNTISTVTDAMGLFSIAVPKGSVVNVSYAGLVSQTFRANSTAAVNVQLEVDQKNIEEVVVVGYGTRKRRDLSTAVSSVAAKEISSVPVADAAQALQGKVAGVTIVQSSGAPGGTGGTGIKIRGISSLTGTNNPLIVVDGYPLPDQSADNVLNSFGTGDIETIDVLKDAGAASIYGVRGSNGVIIITTKRGKAGKTSLSLDVYRGVQEAWELPTSLNAKQYAILNTEARVAGGLAPLPKLLDLNAIESQYGNGTNWLDKIFRRAAIQNVSLTATGGSEKAQFSLSAGYFKQDGIVYRTDFERFNLRFNGDIKVNNHIKIGNSLSMSKYIEHGADTYTPFNSVVILALTSPPTVKPRNDDGTYSGGDGNADGFNEPNPIYQLEVPQNDNVKYRANGNIFAEIGLVKDLKFKALFGADFVLQEINNFSPAVPSSGGRPFAQSGYFAQKSFNPDYLAEYTLTYDKKITARHKLNAVAGYTFQENKFSYVFGGRGGNFRLNIPGLDNQIFTPTDISQIYNGALDGVASRLISYVGRLNYDFDGRGFFGVSVRRDGSSFFAPKNKFAIFPAVSAAWRLTNEPFLENIAWVSDVKVRASFGYTGNPTLANNGPNNPAYQQIINQGFQYTFGNSSGSGGVVPASAVSRSFNPDIKWEKNEQLNVGIDASLFKSRVTVALDVYQRRSKDLILYVAPPFVSGTFEAVPFNTGTLQNRGVDFTLGAILAETKALRWNTDVVVGFYKNKVTSLGLSAPLDGGFSRITGGSLRTTQGQPAQYFFGFVTDGIFQSYEEISKHAIQTAGGDPSTSTAPGDIRFKDLNGDGIINDQDRTNLGNANPDFTYGVTNTINFKNFELKIFLQGSQGNKVLNFTRWYTEGGVSNGNYSNAVIGRWTGAGTSNKMPRLTLQDPNQNNRVSDRFVEDASYFRIKNVRLAYNIPAKLLSRFNVTGTQFYISSQNLLTVTNYTGLDPEVGGAVDYGFYPQARTVLAGISVNF